MGRARPAIEALSGDLIEQTAAALAHDGARRVSALAPKISKKLAAELSEALAALGFERAGTFVRVPLADQLGRLVAREQIVPVSGLKKRLKGATSAAEIGALIRELSRQQRVVVVMRAGKEHLASPTSPVLGGAQLTEIGARVASLQKLIRSTRTKAGQPKRTLLESDVRALLPEWLLSFPSPASPEADPRPANGANEARAELTIPAPATSSDGRVLEEIDAMARAGAPLVFVPALVDRLRGAIAPELIRQALVELAGRGEIELRPESGAGLLGSEQAWLCPRGPGGAPLSYVRRC